MTHKNFGTSLESLKQTAMMEEAIASAGISMDTPDTEWEKEFEKIPRFWKNYPAQKYSIEYVQANVVHTLIKSLLSSRDTYWKERVRKEISTETKIEIYEDGQQAGEKVAKERLVKVIDSELGRYKDRDDIGAQFCRSALQDIREKICILPLQY